MVDDYDYDEPFEDDEEEFDCHMGPDGQCGAAGSEMCDFECPVMAELHAEEARRRLAKRDKRRGPKLPMTD